LGEACGSGGEVFGNVTLREIADCEIAAFDRLHFGIDWGYAVDPFCFVAVHYDSSRSKIFIFDEIFRVGLSNRAAASQILSRYPRARITADSAEPKSIDELISLGVRVSAAKKGAGSVSFGIKWLASLEGIIIDPVRCPFSAREFSSYEYPPDGRGGFRSVFPDEDNHSIDAVRYAMEREMRSGKSGFLRVR
jgi:phage terminase large subunit